VIEDQGDPPWAPGTTGAAGTGIVDETMQREAAARLDAWMAAPSAAPSSAAVDCKRIRDVASRVINVRTT